MSDIYGQLSENLLNQSSRSSVFIVNFEHILHPFSSVYIVYFKQVNFCWVLYPQYSQLERIINGGVIFPITLPAITCLKLTIETLEQDVKYVQI